MDMKAKSPLVSANFGKWQFTPRLIPTLITLVCFILLVSLGCWQLDRAKQKTEIINNYQLYSEKPAVPLMQANSSLPYQHVSMQGRYDQKHQFLLDNQFHNHKLGYHVITPFHTSQQTVLVNRGWIPRHHTQSLITPNHIVTITGILYKPAKAFTLSDNIMANKTWPRIIEALEVSKLKDTLDSNTLYKSVLQLSPTATFGFVRHWDPVVMKPAKHHAYALQWFTFALILLIIFIATNTRKHS